MAEEPVVGVRRRGREEIARLAALYRKSGMGRSEFCRSHGMALSTLVHQAADLLFAQHGSVKYFVQK